MLCFSGVGVHYEASVITQPKQSPASGIIVGERMPPGEIFRLADFRPYDIHDILPSDNKFKILVFTGDTSNAGQRAKVDQLASVLEDPQRCLFSLTQSHVAPSATISVSLTTISHVDAEDANITSIPGSLRTHWSNAYIDPKSLFGGPTGNYYSHKGIPDGGVIVVCRPDGYVSMVVALSDVSAVEAFFVGFMTL